MTSIAVLAASDERADGIACCAARFFPVIAVLVQIPGCVSGGVTDKQACDHEAYPVQRPLVADFTGDGRLDVVVRSYDSYSLFRQSDNGLADAEHVFPPEGRYPSGLAVLELAGDPRIALLRFDLSLSVYVGNSPPFESRRLDGAQCSYFHGVADVDGDGNGDIVCSLGPNFGSETFIRVMRGDGDGNFGAAEAAGSHATSTCVSMIGVVLEDMDGDGATDILGTCELHELVMLHNDGSGRFEEQWAYGRGRTIDVAAGDFDGDGRTDAATLTLSGGVRACRTEGKATLRVHTRLDSGRPSKDPASYEVGFRPTNLSVDDLDGDGLADIVVGDHVEADYSKGPVPSSVLLYLLVSGRGPAIEVLDTGLATMSTQSTAVTVGDVDDDGDADIVVTSYPYMGILENLGGASFAPLRIYDVDVEPR